MDRKRGGGGEGIVKREEGGGEVERKLREEREGRRE